MAEYVPPEAPDLYVEFDNDELPEPDLDAPLLEHRYERTVPKVTGAPWDMAAWIAGDRARRAEAGNFDAGGHTEIVARAWLCSADDLPRAPKPIAKRLIQAGWEVRCACSISYVTPTLFVAASEGENAHSKGDVRYEDRDEWWWSIHAVMRKQDRAVAAFSASWVTKEQVGVKPGTEFVDAAMHDLVLHAGFTKRATEFKDWLAIFAPA